MDIASLVYMDGHMIADNITYEMDDADCDGHYMRATYSDGHSAEIMARYTLDHGDPDWMSPDDWAEAIIGTAAMCEWDLKCEFEEREMDMIARDKAARYEL